VELFACQLQRKTDWRGGLESGWEGLLWCSSSTWVDVDAEVSEEVFVDQVAEFGWETEKG
jgi:hypothetical protein